jgi:hypothetical protein
MTHVGCAEDAAVFMVLTAAINLSLDTSVLLQ